MIDHFGINCADLEASARFYDAVLGVLGHRRLMDVGVAIGYGTDKPDFWIAGGDAASGPNREIHVGFTADSADTVRRWYATAVELGAESLHEPRLWPEYHERYFGALRARPRRQQRRGGLSPRRQLSAARGGTSAHALRDESGHRPPAGRPTATVDEPGRRAAAVDREPGDAARRAPHRS